jgi:hypothetical protein
LTQSTNFENICGFEFSALTTPTFDAKETFEKA